MHRLPPLVPETKAGKLQIYLQEAFYNEKVVVTRTDRKASRKIVQGLIQIIMHNIVSQRGGQLYSEKLYPAGSTATQTKIGKADEYDYNIVLNDNVYIGSDDVHHPYDRTQKYKFKNSYETKCLSVHFKADHYIQEHDKIPNGYVKVFSDNNAANYLKNLTHKGEIVPRWVQEDLYKRVETALREMGLNDVIRLQCIPHGPAITMIVKDPKIGHEISVDLSASIQTDIEVRVHGWPRNATREFLDEEHID